MDSVRWDFSQLHTFERRLALASQIVEQEAETFQQTWGEELADEMQMMAPVLTGTLRDSIDQVEPGGIAIGAPYWRFVEYGTSRMPPQPFVGPAARRVLAPAAKDAEERAVRLITKG